MPGRTATKGMSVQAFQKQLKEDRLTRMRFINGLANLLEDMGVSSTDIAKGLPTGVLSRGKLGGSEVSVVITSKTDSDKNSTSVVIW